MGDRLDTQGQGAPVGARFRASFAPKPSVGTPRARDPYWQSMEKHFGLPVGRVKDPQSAWYGEYVYQPDPIRDPGRWVLVDPDLRLGAGPPGTGIPVPDPGDWAEVGRVPPLLGEVAGGVGGAMALPKAALLTGPLGAGAGRMAGESASQGLGQLLGNVEPRSPQQVARQQAGEAAQAVVADAVLGIPAAALVRGLGAPGARAMADPANRAFRREAVEHGMVGQARPTLSDLTQSPGTARVESYLAETWTGSGAYRERLVAQFKQLRSRLDALFPPSALTEQEAGRRVVGGVADFMDETRRISGQQYGRVRGLARQAQINFGAAHQSAYFGPMRNTMALLDARLLAGPMAPHRQYKGVYEMVREVLATPTLRYDELQELVSEISSTIRQAEGKIGKGAVADAPLGQLKHLYQVMRGDLSRYFKEAADSGNPLAAELGQAWQAADRWYAKRSALAKSRTGREILKIGGDDPARVIEWLFKSRTPGRVQQARQLMGQQAWDDAVQQWATDTFFSKVRVELVTATGEVAAISAPWLKRQITQYGEEYLTEVLGADGFRRLVRFSAFADRFNALNRLAGNPSGTGRILMQDRTMGRVMDMVTAAAGAATGRYTMGDAAGLALGGAGAVATPYALARWMLSGRAYAHVGKGMTPGVRATAGAARVGAREAGKAWMGTPRGILTDVDRD